MRGIAIVLAFACECQGRRAQITSRTFPSHTPIPESSPPEELAKLLLASSSAFGFDQASNIGRALLRPANGRLAQTSMQTETQLYDPAQRDARYGSPLNVAQYLVDLHDAKATFDFCGGMMFQLVLTDKLRDDLVKVAEAEDQQPVVFDKTMVRMANTPEYSRSAHADNMKAFHGREIRQVRDAAGGMGFVLQLSSPEDDPDGWTQAEVSGYDGWKHDSGRQWRNARRHAYEGHDSFKTRFGGDAFSLHHRFYLHFDAANKLWLSAEDGCEGTPATAGGSLIQNAISKVVGRFTSGF
mmetsp:Transcript_5459/g.8883  ORF Transcript_5459/g.8883 Transcript_5459/m.8883 type:complete len:297 (-) Transcript_5459:10-900(-)|eukprot:CAMPEP_0169157150 /NCGR_PEP_ID=MMETSP1015-20121227/54428_1 /TAXON_ID=342587 /ORGANISM="Karlodinium micrum, Strain CCMP2283" /LENGTH=296 /DNA_ID=CAMNT_0009228061 /DNA_START=49 /DNA_END=939 /DNA_ORIENTATION=-